MDGGGAAFAADGPVLAAWRREKRVFLTRGDGPEEDCGEGEQPWVGGVPGGEAWAAWCHPDGGIRSRPFGRGAPRDFRREGARLLYPVVSGSGSGAVFVAWETSPAGGRPARVEGAFLARPRPPK